MVDSMIVHITKRLRQMARELDKRSKYIQENYKITVPQLICLREIYEHGPISLGALTKIVNLNNSTVTGIVDRLERRDLVRRVRISKDRRQIHVEVTDNGIAFIEQAPNPLQQGFVEGLQALEREDVEKILWAIEKLVSLLGCEDAPDELPSEKHGAEVLA